MNLTWALKRLSAMSAQEIGYRVRQNVQGTIERIYVPSTAPAPHDVPSGRGWTPKFSGNFDVTKYSHFADEILAGRFHVFAMHDAQLGFPPQWNRDPKTGIFAPLVFGKTLNYRDSNLVGDIKYLWEPSRHAELVTLAQAWHLTSDEKYAHGCRVMLDSWIEQCPYRMGPHWTSSLEHAIRLINWSFAWYLLGGEHSPLFEGAQGKEFRARWMASIYQHCEFIAGHFSRFSSANNHLLGELAGLFIASTAWPFWEKSAEWQRRAQSEFEEQALLQNGADGVNREQANWYHYEVAEMMMLVGLIARSNGHAFSDAYWQRLRSMLEYIASIMDVGGNVPAFGDADDAVIARLDPALDANVYRGLLAIGAVVFESPQMKHKVNQADREKLRWLLGDGGESGFDRIETNARGLPIKREFENAGYYILGSCFETTQEIKLVADAGPLGFLSIAAHGHADALSFTLSVGGCEMLVDPGTFAYHTQKRWRDYFKGTAAHNTVRIDGMDQSVGGGAFLWRKHAQTRVRECALEGSMQRLVAEHDGYMRLEDPVLHRREILFDAERVLIEVTDDLICKASHRVEQFWHFSEDCEVEVQAGCVSVKNGTQRITITTPHMANVQKEFGSEDPELGWISRAFDTRAPTTSVRVSLTTSGEARLVTRFQVIEDSADDLQSRVGAIALAPA